MVPYDKLLQWEEIEQRTWMNFFITGWISNSINHKVWGVIIYPFSIFNGYTVEVWE